MLSKVFIFVAGAAVGSVATWKFVKTKYEQIANEEIESVREYYKTKEVGDRFAESFKDGVESVEPTVKDAAKEEAKKAMTDYRNYTDAYKSSEEKENEEENGMEDRPYVISPEEFGEAGYDQVSLTYYADGVLTDENDDPIEDVEGLIGEESLEHFGEYEDDSVFVRNDQLGTDYEILKDLSNYHS